jgi:hypothetical protein
VDVDPGRLAFRAPFAAAVLVLADQLLLLRVNRHDRLTRPDMGGGPGVYVRELGVPVGMLRTFDRLRVAPQREPLGVQQIPDGLRVRLAHRK